MADEKTPRTTTPATPAASSRSATPREEGTSRTPRRARARNEMLRVFGAIGIVGIGTAVGAILGAADVDAWIIGLVVSLVVLALGLLLRRSLPL